MDDRALNGHVLKSLDAALKARGPGLKVLEIGAGIGTMLERLVDRGILADARYEGIDSAPCLVAEARRRVPAWARDRGFTVAEGAASAIRLERGGSCVCARFETADLYEFIDRERGKPPCQIGKILQVLQALGLRIGLTATSDASPEGGAS